MSHKKKGSRKPHKRNGQFLGERVFVWFYFILIILAAILFFRELLFEPSRMLFGTDMVGAGGVQLREYAVKSLKQFGEFPLWMNLLYSGVPYLANLNVALYPTTLLYFIFPIENAIGFGFFLNFILAGLFMYLFARSQKLSVFSSAFAGVSYMFTGVLVSAMYGGHDARMICIIFFPLTMYFLEKGFEKKNLFYFLLMGASMGLALLGAHVQMAYFSGLAVFAYFVYKLVLEIIRKRGFANIAKLILFAGLGGLFALVLGAVQVLPTINMLQYMVRGEGVTGYKYASSWAMPWQEVLSLLNPNFVGTLGNYWGTNYFKLHSEYLGMFPIFFAIVALFFYRKKLRWFWLGLGGFALLFSLGAATPVHRLAYYIIPMVKKFRGPSMFFFVFAFSVCLLAGYGAETLINESYEDRIKKRIHNFNRTILVILSVLGVLFLLSLVSKSAVTSIWKDVLFSRLSEQKIAVMNATYSKYLVGFLVMFVLLFLAWWLMELRRKGKLTVGVFASLLVVITLLDLYPRETKFLKTMPIRAYRQEDNIVRFLHQDKGIFRVYPFPNTYGPNDLLKHGIASAYGSQNFRLRWYEKLIGRQGSDILMKKPVADLLNVKYLILPQAYSDPLLDGYEPIFQAPNKWTVYLNKTDVKFVWLVAGYRIAGSEDDAISYVKHQDFNPFETVVLEKEPKGGASLAGRKGEIDGEMDITLFSPNKVTVDVSAPADAFLVLSQTYYPLWQATIDGKGTEIFKSDGAIQSIFIPAGQHKVEFRYLSKYYRMGKILSALGIILTIISLVVVVRKEKRG